LNKNRKNNLEESAFEVRNEKKTVTSNNNE
jgi:hypothetical protein